MNLISRHEDRVINIFIILLLVGSLGHEKKNGSTSLISGSETDSRRFLNLWAKDIIQVNKEWLYKNKGDCLNQMVWHLRKDFSVWSWNDQHLGIYINSYFQYTLMEILNVIGQSCDTHSLLWIMDLWDWKSQTDQTD